jgi:hypothetical protein
MEEGRQRGWEGRGEDDHHGQVILGSQQPTPKRIWPPGLSFIFIDPALDLPKCFVPGNKLYF